MALQSKGTKIGTITVIAPQLLGFQLSIISQCKREIVNYFRLKVYLFNFLELKLINSVVLYNYKLS